MRKKVLKRINAALGAVIVGLAGTTLTSCEQFATDYGVEPIIIDDPHVIALYGVRPAQWEQTPESEAAEDSEL
ncbi:MAG: hypothetical protein IKO63_08070 [Paludibacteraceae bacterium]|nr:hypothetical protein [Paludibacteraceae bacterium]